MDSDAAQRKKASKPAIEKRRRARINESVTKLAEMVMDSDILNQNRSVRLQKSYILETAVDYVKKLKQQEHRSGALLSRQSLQQRHLENVSIIAEKYFQSGYRLCMSEVQGYFLRHSRNKMSSDFFGVELRRFLLRRMSSLLNERWASRETQTEESDLPQFTTNQESSSDVDVISSHLRLDDERMVGNERFKSGSSSSDSSGSNETFPFSPTSETESSSSGDEPMPDEPRLLQGDEIESDVSVWRPW